MKNICIEELISATNKNKNICLIVNDLGYGMIETYAKKFPKNIYNAGVSEQSMMGYAAGLAATGKHVFVYCSSSSVDNHDVPSLLLSLRTVLGSKRESKRFLTEYPCFN